MHSKFGNLFRKAADATAAQVKHDGFDLSVIEIKKEDLRKVYGPFTAHFPPGRGSLPRHPCPLSDTAELFLVNQSEFLLLCTDYLSINS